MTKVFASRLAEAEKTESTRAAGSRLELSNASALVDTSEAALADASAKVNAIRVSWQRHIDDYTADDFAVASAEVERCSERKIGAENGLRFAERSVIYDDSAVALAMRDLIAAIIPSVPIHHTFVKDGSVMPEAKDLPLALIVQTKATEYDKSGPMSGEVNVQFHRTDGLHEKLTVIKLTDMAKEMGVRMAAHSVTSRKTTMGVVDECRIKVQAIATKIPFLAKIESHYTNNVGANIPADILSPIMGMRESISGTRDLCYEVRAATVYRNKTAVVSMEVDKTGLRTTVVDVSILYRRHEQTRMTLPDLIHNAFEGMDGSFVNGVGRVASVAKVQSESELWMDASGATISRAIPSLADKPIDTSKTGFEAVGQRVYRLAIESRTK